MTLGAIQEEEPPNRGILETGSEKTTETAKSYQGEEGGPDAGPQRQDKRLTEMGEQGTSHPIAFIPHTALYSLMHGSPSINLQQCFICHDPSGSASPPKTVSGVDTTRTPSLPRTPASSAAVEAAPILSEALQMTPPAPIPATTTSTDTGGPCVI